MKEPDAPAARPDRDRSGRTPPFDQHSHGRGRNATDRCRADTGQVTVLLAISGTAIAVVLILGLARLGAAANDRARARTAADAAALAGATSGAPAARELAERNGGVAEQVSVQGGEATVTVRVGGAVATARARRTFDPAP